MPLTCRENISLRGNSCLRFLDCGLEKMMFLRPTRSSSTPHRVHLESQLVCCESRLFCSRNTCQNPTGKRQSRHDWSSLLYTQLKKLSKSLRKSQAQTGFEIMISAIPVQCSTNWAIKPSGSWSHQSIMSSYLSPQFKYMILHMFICILHLLRVYYELTMWPAPRWLNSSVGGSLHRCRRTHGLESRSGLNFLKAFSQLLKLCV